LEDFVATAEGTPDGTAEGTPDGGAAEGLADADGGVDGDPTGAGVLHAPASVPAIRPIPRSRATDPNMHPP